MYIQPRKLPKLELFLVMEKRKLKLTSLFYFSLEYNPTTRAVIYSSTKAIHLMCQNCCLLTQLIFA